MSLPQDAQQKKSSHRERLARVTDLLIAVYNSVGCSIAICLRGRQLELQYPAPGKTLLVKRLPTPVGRLLA